MLVGIRLRGWMLWGIEKGTIASSGAALSYIFS